MFLACLWIPAWILRQSGYNHFSGEMHLTRSGGSNLLKSQETVQKRTDCTETWVPAQTQDQEPSMAVGSSFPKRFKCQLYKAMSSLFYLRNLLSLHNLMFWWFWSCEHLPESKHEKEQEKGFMSGCKNRLFISQAGVSCPSEALQILQSK